MEKLALMVELILTMQLITGCANNTPAELTFDAEGTYVYVDGTYIEMGKIVYR